MKAQLLAKALTLYPAVSNGRAYVIDTNYNYESKSNRDIKRKITTIYILLYSTAQINQETFEDYLLANDVLATTPNLALGIEAVDYDITLLNYREFYENQTWTSRFKIQYEES